jgi:hypothetical protein
MSNSNIVEKPFNKEIGLQSNISDLSPFLKHGFLTGYFRWSGQIPDVSDLL